MADVELVIKIPEELYKAYKGRPPMLGDAGMDMIAQAIAKGTPLPKGHGDLIDRNLALSDNGLCEFHMYADYVKMRNYLKSISPIIEADIDKGK